MSSSFVFDSSQYLTKSVLVSYYYAAKQWMMYNNPHEPISWVVEGNDFLFLQEEVKVPIGFEPLNPFWVAAAPSVVREIEGMEGEEKGEVVGGGDWCVQ